MIVKVTTGGCSFKGAFQCYLHDKGADTCKRIAWVQTQNLCTDDPAKAWKHMAYTARAQERLKEASGQSRAGRKLEKPVFAFSLAWHPEQSPNREHKLETARAAIRMLGLDEHEAVIVAHRDEPQKHVHVIVNRVHPITGLAGDIRNSKRKFSDFSREYERTHGKIYCAQREANYRERQNGRATRYCDPVIVEAWETTRTGPALIAALKAKGYSLEEGRKRLIIVDPHGKAHNPTRHLKGVRATADIRARLDTREPEPPKAIQPEPAQEEAARREDEQKRREALEQVAAMQRDALAEKHRLECERQEVQHSQRTRLAKSRLVAFYGLREKKAALNALHERIKSAPWWKRVVGITHRDTQRPQNAVRAGEELHGRRGVVPREGCRCRATGTGRPD